MISEQRTGDLASSFSSGLSSRQRLYVADPSIHYGNVVQRADGLRDDPNAILALEGRATQSSAIPYSGPGTLDYYMTQQGRAARAKAVSPAPYCAARASYSHTLHRRFQPPLTSRRCASRS
jgi:hypothetical protein